MMSSVILAIFVLLLYAAIEHALNHGYDTDDAKMFSATGQDGWTKAAILAAVVGFSNYFAPRSGATMAVLFWLAMLAAIAYVVYSWWQDGDQPGEVVMFLIVLIPMSLTFMATAAAVSETTKIAAKWWLAANKAVVIAAFATIIITFFQRRFAATEKKMHKTLAIIALILALLMIFAVFAQAAGGSLGDIGKKNDNGNGKKDIPSIASTWYKFYHYEVLGNEDLSDDFNFGWPANPDGTAESAKAEHFRRIENDPALGAATLANFDVRLGTDFLEEGYHYDQNQSDGQWTTRINQRAKYFMMNQSEYQRYVDRFKGFVDKYATVRLTYKTGLKDQMYMISYGSEDEAPEVIVAETDQPYGDILEYVFLIKGNEFSVPFRTDCGDQPTDVAEIMKEPVQQNPVKTSTPTTTQTPVQQPKSGGGGSTSTPKTGGGGSTPKTGGGGSTTPPITGGGSKTGGGSGGSSGGHGGGGGSSSKVKDPTKGTKVGGNDTKGPGPDTNNGVGAQYSTEDRSTNSGFISGEKTGGTNKSAYDVYKDKVEDLNKTNQTQKVGGDSNTSSYKVPKTGSGSSKSSGGGSSNTAEDKVTVHSNADKGTGNGGIDKPSTEKANSSGVEKALKSDDPAKNTEIKMPD